VDKRLYRSRTDRMLFGVAGGMAAWLNVDPAFVRIVWALLVFAGGAGLLLYIVAAIVIPEAPYGVAPGGGPAAAGTAPGATPTGTPDQPAWPYATDGRRDGNPALILGGFLVLLGLWFFAKDLLPSFDDRLVLPGFLVVLGVFLVFGAMRRR
jgi:phage shock protein C